LQCCKIILFLTAIAIIPARGGSKRIPRKNIRNFCGMPIINYSIRAAIESKLFDEVMVSTDDEEIATLSKEYGARVPFIRSRGNSDDHASTIDVIREVVESYKTINQEFQFACCIYPTAPLVRPARLIEGYEMLKKKDCDTVFPVVRFSYPIWRSLRVEAEKAEMIWPEYIASRSQDLPPAYHDAGQWYWFQTGRAIERGLWTDNTVVLEISEMEVQDIDTEVDWRLAELKFKLLNSTGDRS
jgi:pseudaminic acid cytidylyltransferase